MYHRLDVVTKPESAGICFIGKRSVKEFLVICMFVCMYACLHVSWMCYVSKCMYMYLCVCMYVYVCMHVYVCVCV